ncbi:MAG: glycosyltransferase family 4 protein [Anaerolineae bacterium]|nr:glycosyltransferase family 4 protein [Anaerolineae bacterium]
MGRRALHQVVVGAAPGDAITDHALLLRGWLREAGFRSEIFAQSVAPALAGEVRTYLGYRPSARDELVILHHSIGADVVDALLALDVRLVLIYHNVTPAAFLRGVDPGLSVQLERGRAQLARLRESTVLALADSPYNEAELRQAGYAPTGVLPIALDEARYHVPLDEKLLARYGSGGPNLLFVGRLLPHKCQEDLVRLLYYYRRVEPRAALWLVGSPWVPAYAEWLAELAEELGVRDGVTFAGHVSQSELVTYYRLAHLYVSMSEHEGFGKPLVESMVLGLPVLAYAVAAVPDTLGGSGVLFHCKDYEALAEWVDVLVKDEGLRARIVARQRERAESFLAPAVRQTWQRLLEGIV